jgi:dTDP-glucose 4,6-dehydratase
MPTTSTQPMLLRAAAPGPVTKMSMRCPNTVAAEVIKTGRKLQLHGGGRSVRSFIHARDVAEGTLRVARSGPAGETYHFSTDLYVSIRELVERVCVRMGVKFEDVVEVVGDRPGKDAAYLLDSTKARTTLGWKDVVSLDQGIDETITWINRDLEQLKKQPADYIHKP